MWKALLEDSYLPGESDWAQGYDQEEVRNICLDALPVENLALRGAARARKELHKELQGGRGFWWVGN